MKTIENTDKTTNDSINNNDPKITEKNEKNGKNDGEKINSEEEERIKIKKERDEVVTKTVNITPKQYEEQESEQIKISVELLSSAIKALESHIVSQNNSSASGASASGSHSGSGSDNDSGSASGGSGSGSGSDEVNSKIIDTTQIIAPALGRALGQLGLLYLHPFR